MPVASSSAITSSSVSSCQNGTGLRASACSSSACSGAGPSSPRRARWRPPLRCRPGGFAGTSSPEPVVASLTRRPYPAGPSRRRRARSARDGLALLLDLGGLAAQVAQVVELRAAHVTAGDDLDLVDDRRVEREGPLDTDAEGDLADGEGAADAAAVDADHDTLEDLDPGPVALDDLHVHLDGVTRAEAGDVVALRGVAELGEDRKSV